jgi:hypothetical protein
MIGKRTTHGNPTLLRVGLLWGEQRFEFRFLWYIPPHSSELMIRIRFHSYIGSPCPDPHMEVDAINSHQSSLHTATKNIKSNTYCRRPSRHSSSNPILPSSCSPLHFHPQSILRMNSSPRSHLRMPLIPHLKIIPPQYYC